MLEFNLLKKQIKTIKKAQKIKFLTILKYNVTYLLNLSNISQNNLQLINALLQKEKMEIKFFQKKIFKNFLKKELYNTIFFGPVWVAKPKTKDVKIKSIVTPLLETQNLGCLINNSFFTDVNNLKNKVYDKNEIFYSLRLANKNLLNLLILQMKKN